MLNYTNYTKHENYCNLVILFDVIVCKLFYSQKKSYVKVLDKDIFRVFYYHYLLVTTFINYNNSSIIAKVRNSKIELKILPSKEYHEKICSPQKTNVRACLGDGRKNKMAARRRKMISINKRARTVSWKKSSTNFQFMHLKFQSFVYSSSKNIDLSFISISNFRARIIYLFYL